LDDVCGVGKRNKGRKFVYWEATDAWRYDPTYLADYLNLPMCMQVEMLRWADKLKF
jgi:hypothetical protein